VLGAIEVHVGGQVVAVDGPKPRTLLALLVCAAGRPVPMAQVVDALWGEEPPAGSKAAVYTCVSALRRKLDVPGRELIVRRPGGYLLDVPPEAVDLRRFENLAAEGRAALRVGDPLAAAALLGDALALWRGDAFGALDAPWLNRTRAVLHHERLVAERDLTDLQLRAGRPAALVSGPRSQPGSVQ